MSDIRDLPDTMAAHQAQLRTMMRYDTDPRWHDRPVSSPPPARRSRSVFWIIVVPCIIAGIAVGWAASSRAAEQPPRVWQMWAEGSDKPFHTHKFTSLTACKTDISFVKDGSGKRLSCVRIEQRKGE